MRKGMVQTTKRILALFGAAAIVMTMNGMALRAAADEQTYTAYSSYEGPQNVVQADYSMDKGGTRVVSYCLNNGRLSPAVTGTGGYKQVKVTAENVGGLVGNGSPRIGGSSLINKIFGILLNGYGNDAAGIRAKYGIRDKLFRDATQNAIWYYTDNKEMGTAQHFLKGLNIDVTVEPGLTMLGYASSADSSMDASSLTEEEKRVVNEVRGAVKAYQELLNASVSADYAKHHTLNIYVTNVSGGDAGKTQTYQNMVDVSGITENPKKDVVFSKTAVNGTSELPGATLKVWEGDKLIEEWVSTPETHLIRLFAGDYVMEEITAPEGYLKAESIRFRVTEDMKVQVYENGSYVDRADAKVHMQDAEKPRKEVVFSKSAVNGTSELPGATLKVSRNSDGKVVDEWVSANTTHLIRLLPGEYTMTEITAPEGYEVAENIVFRVTEELKVEIREGENWTPRENATVHMQDAEKPKATIPAENPVNSAPAQPSQEQGGNTPAQAPAPENDNNTNNTPAVNVQPVQPAAQEAPAADPKQDYTQPSSASDPAAKVLGQSRSPQTDDEAPIALLLALFGLASVGIGITTHVWKKS